MGQAMGFFWLRKSYLECQPFLLHRMFLLLGIMGMNTSIDEFLVCMSLWFHLMQLLPNIE